jgi:MSHA biogenesis protein MshP
MNINNQNGFTIVQAIFILVILSLLGAYMVRLGTVQQSTSTQALLQARAYLAAQAGLEWGIYKVTTTHSCATWDAGTPKIEGFSVGVECEKSDLYYEGDDEIYIYNLKATASYPDVDALSNLDYVSRTLRVTIHD